MEPQRCIFSLGIFVLLLAEAQSRFFPTRDDFFLDQRGLSSSPDETVEASNLDTAASGHHHKEDHGHGGHGKSYGSADVYGKAYKKKHDYHDKEGSKNHKTYGDADKGSYHQKHAASHKDGGGGGKKGSYFKSSSYADNHKTSKSSKSDKHDKGKDHHGGHGGHGGYGSHSHHHGGDHGDHHGHHSHKKDHFDFFAEYNKDHGHGGDHKADHSHHADDHHGDHSHHNDEYDFHHGESSNHEGQKRPLKAEEKKKDSYASYSNDMPKWDFDFDMKIHRDKDGKQNGYTFKFHETESDSFSSASESHDNPMFSEYF